MSAVSALPPFNNVFPQPFLRNIFFSSHFLCLILSCYYFSSYSIAGVCHPITVSELYYSLIMRQHSECLKVLLHPVSLLRAKLHCLKKIRSSSHLLGQEYVTPLPFVSYFRILPGISFTPDVCITHFHYTITNLGKPYPR
jgi:hypothetical protein